MKIIKKIVSSFILLILILSTFACSVNNSQLKKLKSKVMNFSMADGAIVEDAEEEVAVNGSANAKMMAVSAPRSMSAATSDLATDDRKIVKTVDINAETTNFEDTIEWVKSHSESFNAVISNSYIDSGNKTDENYRRSANFVIKVPSDKLEPFINKISRSVNITFQQENIQDVTENYDDTSSRLNTLKVEEMKLTELMARAQNVEELIKIEEKMGDVRREIQNITLRLKRLTNKVANATVNLYITEVKTYTDAIQKDDFSRENLIKMLNMNFEATKKFVLSMGVFLFTHIPSIVLLMIVIIIVLIIVAIVKGILSIGKRRRVVTENKNVESNVTKKRVSRKAPAKKVERVEKSSDGNPIV